METLSRKPAGIYRADIVALDADDAPIMLVEVKARHEDNEFDREQLQRYLQAAQSIPYAMLVTLRDIHLYEWKSQTLSLLLTAPAADVLSDYEPEFRDKNIYEYYLATLVEAWLRDVAYHWKSAAPPLFDQLTQLGLVKKLDNGTTRREQEL